MKATAICVLISSIFRLQVTLSYLGGNKIAMRYRKSKSKFQPFVTNPKSVPLEEKYNLPELSVPTQNTNLTLAFNQIENFLV